ncbi:hypothetical protein [Mesorhizobium sp. WSM4313]|uniref:hypothetical protein n=1 Tax=Mesorhizobium sp. WSM4313 TaxID=2029412 RepID=UPI0015968BD0
MLEIKRGRSLFPLFTANQQSGQSRRPSGSSWLPQPHTSAAAVFWDELDAGGLEGRAHLVHAADPSILACFEPIDRIASDACRLGKVEGAPIEGCTPHAALNWLHVVLLSP